MKSHLMGHAAIGLAAGLWIVIGAQVVQAFPSRAGNCSYCHATTKGVLDITGFDHLETVAGTELKTFTLSPGGTTQFMLTALEKGDDRYAIILNRLDLLNEQVQYTPRLYMPDPDWSSNRGDSQYLSSNGRYYATAVSDLLQTYPFDLGVGPLVMPGFYTLEARMAGGIPDITGWNTITRFGLRVVPEPGATPLLLIGLAFLLTAPRARRQPNTCVPDFMNRL